MVPLRVVRDATDDMNTVILTYNWRGERVDRHPFSRVCFSFLSSTSSTVRTSIDMVDLSNVFLSVETFRIGLLVLLASLLLSLLLSQSLPYFVASAICFLAALGSLSSEHLRGSITCLAHVDVVTTLSFTILLTATSSYALVLRSNPVVLRAHTAATLAGSILLALKAFMILHRTTSLLDQRCAAGSRHCSSGHLASRLDQRTLVAVGFASMHLLAALLQLHESSCAKIQLRRESYDDEKITQLV